MTDTAAAALTAFTAHRADIIGEFAELCTAALLTVTAMAGRGGVLTFRQMGPAGSGRLAGMVRLLRGVIALPGNSPRQRVGLPVELDAVKVAAAGERYADEVIGAMVAKVAAKVGDLIGATLVSADGGSFRLTGMRGGASVSIDQRRITNTSANGLRFHQWPARISIDGRIVSAEDYAALSA